MQRFAQDREVVLYCDLHGHSRKQNVFVYGCNNQTNPSLFLRERIFPYMMHLNGPDHFSYKSLVFGRSLPSFTPRARHFTPICCRSSRFAVRKSKESTGRVVTWRDLVGGHDRAVPPLPTASHT